MTEVRRMNDNDTAGHLWVLKSQITAERLEEHSHDMCKLAGWLGTRISEIRAYHSDREEAAAIIEALEAAQKVVGFADEALGAAADAAWVAAKWGVSA